MRNRRRSCILDPVERLETIQWLFFQMAAVGRMFGQLCVSSETKRLLGVLETRLTALGWIKDKALYHRGHSYAGCVRTLIGFYEARDLIEYDDLHAVPAWLDRGMARPAVQRGVAVRAPLSARARPG